MSGREAPAAAIQARIAAHGARAIDPPVLQPAGVYLELLGEALRARALVLTADAGAEELCLRPDMTAPACRAVAALPDLPADGLKVWYDGLVFRRAPPGSRRETEFRQIGMEAFGPAPAIAALEPRLLADAVMAVRAAGVEPVVRLGDVGLFSDFVARLGLSLGWTRRLQAAFGVAGGMAAALAAAEAPPAPPDPLAEAVADLPPEAGVQLVERLLAAQSGALVGRDAATIARRLAAKGARQHEAAPPREAIDALRALLAIEAPPEEAFAAADKLGATVAPAAQAWGAACALIEGAAPAARFSPGFGRGFAYYTGRLFELEAPRLGDRASLGGGGRYDGLLPALTDALPASAWKAAGFALRPGRIAEAAA